MKFQPRRFVVEVKRGTSRAAFTSPDTVSEKFTSAEDMLFGGAAKPTAVHVMPPSEAPAERRILASLIEPPPPVAAVLPERPRRGRKPGSKNKPKIGLAPLPAATPLSKQARFTASSGRSGFAEDSSGWREQVVRAELISESAQRPPNGPREKPGMASPQIAQTRTGRLRDRSAIIKRYVLGTEPAPGQPGYRRARRASLAQ